MSHADRSIGILYEHPEWFALFFAELDRRGIRYERVLASQLQFDPSQRVPYSLVVNRMSPSAYTRGHEHAMFASLSYLQALDLMGIPVVNGAGAFGLELSKTAQIALLARLGLPHPATRVINTVRQAAEAARHLVFPVVVKPNIGGSGAKIQRFESPDQLETAAAGGRLDLGIDHTALVQEYHPPVGGFIVRVEVLDGQFLYAIKVYPDPSAGFNLCPADICQTDPVSLGGRPAIDGARTLRVSIALPKTTLRVEGYAPPREIVDNVLRIARAARIDVGGIEYLISERDGRPYFYDINALSNFVTDAPRVVGFDPVPVFVDYIVKRAQIAAAVVGTS